ATTTQLVNAKTGQWDYELMELLDIPKDIFLSLNMPGTVVGKISAEMISKTGFTCNVIQCATHDTASAVMAVPSESNDSLYISSGTWSLMGVENNRVQNSEKARLSNFTNEGGYDHRYRFLKNIMGLWMIQSVRHEEGDRIPFVDYAEMARENDDFGSLVDVNDLRFLAPESMIDEIKAACAEGGQRVPETSGELAAVIYNSLADSYAKTVAEIEEITGKKYDAIHIVGGGCKNRYLNQITASASGLPVYAGPAEATAIGNALSQMIALGDFKDLGEARACVYESFEIDTYRP
ncbi:MAG: rhamnulokinase, partial [Lachnospiraceae bacterium]|nr:rhamnulokinase [Lachnospiraceae bacterium]